ncbi:VOC family protein [Capnocytophaga canis]|uniref:VOC family protein n=1 Tax=Capnocytophaga canis TaxID=1848903 RepID=UPI0038580D4D
MKIDHIALYVNDLEKTKEFFVKYFDGKSNEEYHNKKQISVHILFHSMTEHALK